MQVCLCVKYSDKCFINNQNKIKEKKLLKWQKYQGMDLKKYTQG